MKLVQVGDTWVDLSEVVLLRESEKDAGITLRGGGRVWLQDVSVCDVLDAMVRDESRMDSDRWNAAFDWVGREKEIREKRAAYNQAMQNDSRFVVEDVRDDPPSPVEAPSWRSRLWGWVKTPAAFFTALSVAVACSALYVGYEFGKTAGFLESRRVYYQMGYEIGAGEAVICGGYRPCQHPDYPDAADMALWNVQ